MSAKNKWREVHKIESQEYDREYYRKSQKRREDKRRQAQNWGLKKKYGITLEEKQLMYVAQKGLCAACGKPLPEDFTKACVDHDHLTGVVRQLLHRTCNIVLGYEENEPGIIEKVLEYKKRWDAITGVQASD